MSRLIQNNTSFLKLLLNSEDKAQQRALLQSITAEQLNALGEIFYNLLNIVPLDRKGERMIKRKDKKRKLLQNLSLINKKTYNSRRKLLKSNKSMVFRILLHFKDKLLQLIDSQPLVA